VLLQFAAFENPTFPAKLAKNAQLPNPSNNFHYQTLFKDSKSDLFGILKCQLATL